MNRICSALFSFVSALLVWHAGACVAPPPGGPLLTRAESSGFSETTRYDEVMRFLRVLETRSDLMLLRTDLGADLHTWVGRDISLYLVWGGQFAFRVSPGSGTDFMLTGGAGLRSGAHHWDIRFTGHAVIGEANVDHVWIVAGGFRF